MKSFTSSGNVNGGRLIGSTDTDYFYFFCPKCKDTNILQVFDYQIVEDKPVEYMKEERKKHKKDFIIKFDLYCPKCKMRDIVKISNSGWQGGKLKETLAGENIIKNLHSHIEEE